MDPPHLSSPDGARCLTHVPAPMITIDCFESSAGRFFQPAPLPHCQRTSSAPDSSARANLLHGLKGPLKNAVQRAAREPRGTGNVIGVFDLAMISVSPSAMESRPDGDAEQMTHSFEILMTVNVRAEIKRVRGKVKFEK